MASEIALTVKHQRELVKLALPATATVGELQERLEELTGVMVRHQKLILAGKVVSGAKGTLEAAGVKAGAKLMLLAAGGDVGPSQGAAALAAAKRTEEHRRRMAQGAQGPPAPRPPPSLQARAEGWRKTGVAAVQDLKLEALPPELLALGGSVRVLDAGGNRLIGLPAAAFTALAGLQRLRLSMNGLTDDGLSPAWPAIASLPQLAVLALDSNLLTALPDCVSGLTRLQKLTLNDNRLESLPECVSALSSLQALSVRGNRLAALPAGLAACARLEEVDLARNAIQALPRELSALTSLKILLLDKNRIRSVPPEVLTGCLALQTLSLHENPITAETLRETPGYGDFDARRRAKHDKGLSMKLAQSFDEGVDHLDSFERWKPG